jgi:hypothetical protein
VGVDFSCFISWSLFLVMACLMVALHWNMLL